MNRRCKQYIRLWALKAAGIAAVLAGPLLAPAQGLHLEDGVRSYAGLTNTVVTMAGRAELRITGAGDPIPGCVIQLNGPDSFLVFSGIAPSRVASSLLGRVRVDGSNAVLDSNVRVVQYGAGTIVVPHGPDFPALEIFANRYFTGPSKKLRPYVAYNAAGLGSMATNIGSFRLKRGYVATSAQQENGTGVSRCYVAQDGDLEVGLLPSSLENQTRYVRIFPWRWAGKKGVAGNIETGLNVSWLYNWNLDRSSALDWEYVPIRQTRYWPGLDQDWKARGATHVLGYNEPDHADQANVSVTDAISSWPDLLWPGLRVGAPAVSDGGLSWLYDFISRADAAGLRVDYVPVHYYRCYGNAGDPNGTAQQFYNFLKGIYDVVKRPLWVTEWNNGANWTSCADPSFAQQDASVSAMIDMLDNTYFVERYAIYNWVEDVRRVKWDDGSLTAAGVTYRDQVSPLAYKQEMADAGTGSSARYAFDGDAHDGWGNGQDAMLVGAPTFTAGKYGQAIALDGVNDYLQLSPRLADTTDWSFAGWIYWNGGGNWQRIFDFGEDTSHYLFLTPKSGSGTLRFAINTGSGEQSLNGPALTAGAWTHVAVSISGNTGKLFVNGAAVATNTSMTANPSDVGTKFNYLGRSRFPADPLFGGRFDDFRFVSSALTDGQVAAIVNTPPPQFRSALLYKPDATAQQTYAAGLSGDAAGSGALTFSKMAGPAWLSVAANGALTGTPRVTDGGVNSFLVRVTDPNGSLHTATLLVTVSAPITTVVSSSADDAEEAASGAMNLTSTDLELVNDDAGGAGNQLIGLRFADIPIPRGAIITNAFIQFTADESQAEVTTLSLFAQASDDAAPFASTARNVSSRPLTTTSVPWQPGAWNAGEANNAQRTPNLAGLIQEVVSRPGWTNGHGLVFVISGSGHRTADSYDKSGGLPARLAVQFTASASLITANSSINSGANDAEQAASGGVTLDSTDLELVNDAATGSGDQMVGLRFENVNVPAGAVVSGATIQFSADETQSEATSLTIHAQAADNAVPFSTAANNLSARPATVSAVAWPPSTWNTIGERGPQQRTPDLSGLVREVIARPGWSNGNAMVFLISGSGHRTAEAADKLGGVPATLSVSYWPQIPPGTFAHWAALHPAASGPTTDLDSDGYENLMEYALGMELQSPQTGALELTSDASHLFLRYTRAVTAADVGFQVQWADSIDAATWSSAGVTQQIVSDDGGHRVVLATAPKGSGKQRFLRLKVTN